MSSKIIISGGGTGGHIFPAVAIANALKKLQSDCQIQFIGAKGKMEMQKVPDAGYPIKGLWISGWQRKQIISNLSFPFKLLVSMMQARRIIKDFNPDIVIGTGGYASGPALKSAIHAGIPIVIQEQNSFPGITNRVLASKAERIYTAYDNMETFFPKTKIEKCGNPVRAEIARSKVTREEALKFFDLQPDKPIVLIVGGSQGARSINQSIKKNLNAFHDNDYQLIWQTGKNFFSEALLSVQDLNYSKCRVRDFIQSMHMAYAAADVVISRAGALAIAELCLASKPVIFVPFPSAAADHQTANAQAMVSKNAALMIRDSALDAQLIPTLNSIINNSALASQLSSTIGALGIKDADMQIAHSILQIIKTIKANA